QTRISEHSREIGEPSQRVLERIARRAARTSAPPLPSRDVLTPSPPSPRDGSAPSPPSQSDGAEGWGERAPLRHDSAPVLDDTLRPLTPTLSPEQARGKGSGRRKLANSRQRGENNQEDECGYAELHCLSNFSFQRGASSAGELFERAANLGYSALAITDECSLAGIVRAHEAAKETGLKLIVGTEVRLADGPKLVVLAADHHGYSDICRLITAGRRRSAKGEYRATRADAERLGNGVCILWSPGPLLSGFGIRDSGFGKSTAPANRASNPESSPTDIESGMS